jgi:phosphoribosylaminoimidazole-succinocarboxamide synthase
VISTAALPLIHEGKVRRLYALSDPNQVLIVATDAISAFDQVLSTPIPDKGAVLTQLSVWWSEQLLDICPNHVVSTEVPPDVVGRAVVCERLEMIPIECVARGYITGSGWAEYQTTGQVTGIELPAGLRHADRLPEPIFTPARKAPLGQHDENISFDQLVDLVGSQVAHKLRDLTLALFARGSRIAAERGVILADTKFEFGRRPDGSIVLADEVLTPDSSRFWDAAQYHPGAQIPSFDKQYVRDWLAYDSGWDRSSDQPAPPLPRMVVQATRDRYLEAYTRLTGRGFRPAQSALVLAQSAPPAPARPQSRFVVDVMPKPEILDPQGKAITGALARMGHHGFSVRQGKRFEIDALPEFSPELQEQVVSLAEALLANTVIENFTVTAVDPAAAAPSAPAPSDPAPSGPIPAGPAPAPLALPSAPPVWPAAPSTPSAAPGSSTAWSLPDRSAPPRPAAPPAPDGPTWSDRFGPTASPADPPSAPTSPPAAPAWPWSVPAPTPSFEAAPAAAATDQPAADPVLAGPAWPTPAPPPFPGSPVSAAPSLDPVSAPADSAVVGPASASAAPAWVPVSPASAPVGPASAAVSPASAAPVLVSDEPVSAPAAPAADPAAPVPPAVPAPGPAVPSPAPASVPAAPVPVPSAPAAPASPPPLNGGALSALSDDLAEALRALKATADAMVSLAGVQPAAAAPAPAAAAPSPAGPSAEPDPAADPATPDQGV